jgi:hypothetical protein
MGIESVSACNKQNNKELEERGEKRFRTLWPRMVSKKYRTRSVRRASDFVHVRFSDYGFSAKFRNHLSAAPRILLNPQ